MSNPNKRLLKQLQFHKHVYKPEAQLYHKEEQSQELLHRQKVEGVHLHQEYLFKLWISKKIWQMRFWTTKQ